ncbi:PREDICTED: cytochrome P450 4C1-like isoform X1 [Wasmannia auropunctata]|uniref:cytochrome P450 4C1-like isoform X1 n=1 Tax=Wasmannia auropunctata TaxID=64793 RepID=UPI0005EECEBD|nr:PREDICTED: cytochrome P450 4C1-like isoform X1 [Wasmannia auropunctata]XP_011706326.1 PREDICTED: cytochrome P450 4C1-like isoform X1 [Wasmannia auropunctata]
MLVTVLLLFILIILVWNYYAHYGRNGRLIDLIPGPSGFPILGNVLQFLGSQEELWKIVSTFNKQYSIFKIWFFFRPSVFINHPDDLETILGSSQHIEKGMIYDAIKPWLGTGLLTSGGNDINITNKGHDATVRHRFNSS